MWSQTKQRWGKLFPFFKNLQQAGIHLLWPGRCHSCNKSTLPSDQGLCNDCWQDLSAAVSNDYCRYCGNDVSAYGVIEGKCGHCQDKTLAWNGMIRVGRYESTLRSVVLALKFAERTEWAIRLSRMLNDAVATGGISDKIDVIVPVPLHWRRRLSRGFNQAHLLAKGLRLSGAPISTDLVRIRHTAQQWDLTAPQRRRNVKGAFAVRRDHTFMDKSILLVDDISTSGATLTECAKTLKDAGAQNVYTAIIAKARQDTL